MISQDAKDALAKAHRLAEQLRELHSDEINLILVLEGARIDDAERKQLEAQLSDIRARSIKATSEYTAQVGRYTEATKRDMPKLGSS